MVGYRDYDDDYYGNSEFDENAAYDEWREDHYMQEQERMSITGDPYYDDPYYCEDDDYGYDF